MSICMICGIQRFDNDPEPQICPHHVPSSKNTKDDWAKANKIMCDFIHRKIEPPRLEKKDRDDEFIS